MEKKPFKLGGSGRGGRFKNTGFILLLIVFGLILYAAFNQPSPLKTVPFSQVITDANSGKVKQITIKGDQELQVTPQGQSQPTEKSFKESGSSIYEQGLKQGKVTVENKPSNSNNSAWLSLLLGTVLPVLIIGGLLIFMFRSAQGQGNQALSFGKSRARLYGNEKDRPTSWPAGNW
jgi:cell division protease FtsH